MNLLNKSPQDIRLRKFTDQDCAESTCLLLTHNNDFRMNFGDVVIVVADNAISICDRKAELPYPIVPPEPLKRWDDRTSIAAILRDILPAAIEDIKYNQEEAERRLQRRTRQLACLQSAEYLVSAPALRVSVKHGITEPAEKTT